MKMMNNIYGGGNVTSNYKASPQQQFNMANYKGTTSQIPNIPATMRKN